MHETQPALFRNIAISLMMSAVAMGQSDSSEVAELKTEVQGLKAEIKALRAELRGMRGDITKAVAAMRATGQKGAQRPRRTCSPAG